MSNLISGATVHEIVLITCHCRTFSPTAKRYIPLLVDDGVMENVQRIMDPSCGGVTELAQKLLNAAKDFQMSGK